MSSLLPSVSARRWPRRLGAGLGSTVTPASVCAVDITRRPGARGRPSEGGPQCDPETCLVFPQFGGCHAADDLLEGQDCFLTCEWAVVTHRTGPKSVNSSRSSRDGPVSPRRLTRPHSDRPGRAGPRLRPTDRRQGRPSCAGLTGAVGPCLLTLSPRGGPGPARGPQLPPRSPQPP